MSDEPIEMDVTGLTRSVVNTTPLGCHDVATPHGLVHFCEGNGLFTSLLETGDEGTTPTAGAIMVYLDGEEGQKGRGIVVQLNATAMREVAASLLEKADLLEPVRPN